MKKTSYLSKKKKKKKKEEKEIKEEKEEKEKEFLINLITNETSMPMETEMEEEEEEIIENRSRLTLPPVPRTYTVKKIQLERDTSFNGISIEIMMKTRLMNASAELR